MRKTSLESCRQLPEVHLLLHCPHQSVTWLGQKTPVPVLEEAFHATQKQPKHLFAYVLQSISITHVRLLPLVLFDLFSLKLWPDPKATE